MALKSIMLAMQRPALQVIQPVMNTVWHVGCSADKPGDCRANCGSDATYIQAHCLYYTAGWLHRIPFAIWHRHVVLASDRCCTVLVPEVTNDLLDCLFFQSQRIICLTMATDATPGTLMEPWVVAACLLTSHLPQMNRVNVCMWEGLSERLCLVCELARARACM